MCILIDFKSKYVTHRKEKGQESVNGHFDMHYFLGGIRDIGFDRFSCQNKRNKYQVENKKIKLRQLTSYFFKLW